MTEIPPPDPLSISFGKRLRSIRESRLLTLQQLALAAGLNDAAIGLIERGARSPTLRTVERLAQGLGVPVHELFK